MGWLAGESSLRRKSCPASVWEIGECVSAFCKRCTRIICAFKLHGAVKRMTLMLRKSPLFLSNANKMHSKSPVLGGKLFLILLSFFISPRFEPCLKKKKKKNVLNDVSKWLHWWMLLQLNAFRKGLKGRRRFLLNFKVQRMSRAHPACRSWAFTTPTPTPTRAVTSSLSLSSLPVCLTVVFLC